MTGPRIALTFDAEHPDRPRCRAGVQDELLEAIDRLDVRATFFIQGRWAEAYPTTASRVGAAGHLVGSHGFYHARMPLLTDDGLREDIKAAEEAIRSIVGVSPVPWFRCPFGAGHDDSRVLAAIRAAGYRNVHWDVWAEDWEPDRTASGIVSSVVDGALDRGDGAIVLLHTWPEPTLEAIPGIVAGLRDGGATLVTLDVLLDPRDSAGEHIASSDRAPG